MSKQAKKERQKQHKVLGQLFNRTTQERLDAMQPQNSVGSTLATLQSMSVPRILKLRIPPVPMVNVDGEPVLQDNGEQMTIDTGQYALIRDTGWEKDNRPKYFQTVTESYEQVGAYEVAEMLDSLPNFKPDSVSFRNAGETMLVSMKLDEIQMSKPLVTPKIQQERDKWGYDPSNDDDGGVNIEFFLIDPMGGSGTIKGGLKATVKVCANGLTIPMGMDTFSITHTTGAGAYLEDWLNHLWEQATGQVSVYAQALQHLSTIPVDLPEIHWISTELYPQEKMFLKDEWEKQPRRQNWERYFTQMNTRNEKNQQKALTVEQLILGMGRGINALQEKSAWDVMMGVSEFENYKRTKREYDTSPIKIFEGDRLANMHKAYEMVLGLESGEMVMPEHELVPVLVNS